MASIIAAEDKKRLFDCEGAQNGNLLDMSKYPR